MAIITVHGLRKRYGTREVLRDIDLTIDEGEIFGIVGPNGSGKTTAVECIGGLRRRDGGSVEVAGMDPAAGSPRLRELLGMQLQAARLQPKLTVREALDLYASFYRAPRAIEPLLEQFGLVDHAQTRFEQLSGGQQQRLSIALALVGTPRIAMLDELTTGLDPRARREIWSYLAGLRDDGTTIVLVTHSMEEAQFLCDRIAVIADGEVRAVDSPDGLATRQAATTMSFVPSGPVDLDALAALIEVHSADERDGRIEITGDDAAPQRVLALLAELGVTAGRLRVTEPSLDDAYLALTEQEPS